MDSEYDRKFEEMKKYIPFLESMIKRLESTTSTSNPRQAQLDKIRSLRDLLMDKKKRMKMENLLKCEQVLVNLYAKVEQRDSLAGPKKDITSEKCTTNLNVARNKLKTVVSKLHHESDDTLPEIARASETEEICVPGSKEPALFQRRPNIPLLSPTCQSPSLKKEPSPHNVKRNYTRLLLSPERNTKTWTKDPPSDEKSSFISRSPKNSPRRPLPSYHRKERKKDETNVTQSKDLNITLNVPEESLLSLNTKDIVSRIINCNDNDVDIDTLRELRTQILGELKETGAKDDISDIILKSYKKKDAKDKKNEEVEEGELSDSESEAIESIYGSLVIMDKDKSSKSVKTENTDNSQCKIQICLVINSDKQNQSSPKDKDKVINVDSSDFETFHKIGAGSEQNELIMRNEKDISTNTEDVSKNSALCQSPMTDSFTDETKKIDSEDNLNSESNPKHSQDSSDRFECINNIETIKPNFYKPIIEDVKNEDFKDLGDNSVSKPESEKGILKTTDNISEKVEILNNKYDVEIPLLDSHTTSQQNIAKDEVSEIDILQALKNEILSETSNVLNTDMVTPLFQPKITKVTNAQEIGSKKRISIEKYKAKTITNSKSAQNYVTEADVLKKQSLKLTEKECERFNFLSKISLDASSDEEEKSNMSTDDIYGNSAPKSPDHEDFADKGLKPPVIIPSDPVETPVASSEADIDMRKLLPHLHTQEAASKLLPFSPSFIENVPKTSNENNLFKNIETQLPHLVDPRMKRESNPLNIQVNSVPNLSSNILSNSTMPIKENVSLNFSQSLPVNVSGVPSNLIQNMTPNRTQVSMSPNLALNMTPNISQNIGNMTPNMTPSRQTYDNDDGLISKHVYAPTYQSFDTQGYTEKSRKSRWVCDNNTPFWEDVGVPRNRSNKIPVWENDLYPRNTSNNTPVWEDGNSRSGSMQRDSDYLSPYDHCNTGQRYDTFNDNRDPYSRKDCITPQHPFRMDCPATPTPSFGRIDPPMTPVHSFGRLDCPPTPSHPFGRQEPPNAMSNIYSGSDYTQPTSNQNFCNTQDPRLNRNPDYDNTHCRDRERYNFYESDQNNRYSHSDSYRRFQRELSVGRNERNKIYDQTGRDYREPQVRRETIVGRQYNKEVEGERSFPRNRGNSRSYDYRHQVESKSYDESNRRGYPHERSASRNTRDASPPSSQISPSARRAVLKENKPNVYSQSEHSLTIDTESSFHERNKNNNSTIDARRQRATSVGRSLACESTGNRGSHESKQFSTMSVSENKNRSFRRASSVGREIRDTKSDFKDIKDSLKSFKLKSDSRVASYFEKKNVSQKQSQIVRNSSRKEIHDADNKSSNTKGKYSPRKNNRDPRMRRESYDLKYRNRDHKRSNSRDSKNCGIVYSHDNITKGTILGSGYGVKNYKIPKIKRNIEVTECSSTNNSTIEGNMKDKNKNEHIIVEENIEDKKKHLLIKSTHTGLIKDIELTTGIEKQNKDNHEKKILKNNNIVSDDEELKNNKQEENKTEIITETSFENNDRRMTRSARKNLCAVKNLLEISPVKRTRKPKKAFLLESDSDDNDIKKAITKNDTSGLTKSNEIESENVTRAVNLVNISNSEIKSMKPLESLHIVCNDSNKLDIKNKNSSVTTQLSIIEKQEQSILAVPASEESLNNFNIKSMGNCSKKVREGEKITNFGMDDLEIFSDNIASDPVIDNINALIADLDDDLEPNKNLESSKSQFTQELNLETMLENISNPDMCNNKNDLNLSESTELSEKKASNTTDDAKDVKALCNKNPLDICLVSTTDVKESISNTVVEENVLKAEQSKILPIQSSESDAVPKIYEETTKNLPEHTTDADNNHNESVVSTTDNKEQPKTQTRMECIGGEDIKNIIDTSNNVTAPDSTIQNSDIVDTELQRNLPDSTDKLPNDMMNSDVTSTHNIKVTPNKDLSEPVLSNTDTSEIENIGKLLSILQDKSKIKELLGLLGDQSNENDKIKKKLEKLSEIVSDEEDFSKANTVKKEVDGNLSNVAIEKTEPMPNQSSKISNAETTSNDNENVINVDQNNLIKNIEEDTDKRIKLLNDKTDSLVPIKTEDVPIDKEGNQNTAVDNLKNTKNKKTVKNTISKKGKKKSHTKNINTEDRRLTRSDAAGLRIKTPTMKKPSRELENLQRDIKEMSIRDDILNATGIRMCRIAKLVDEKRNTKQINLESTHNENEPIVVLRKCKNLNVSEENVPIERLKKVKGVNSNEIDKSTQNCETKLKDNNKIDPYDFETDSINEANITSDKNDDGSESDFESMCSSKSFGSTEHLTEVKKKQKRKRGKGWKAGIIKTKKKKTNINRDDTSPDDKSELTKPGTEIPDLNCFIDKTYCFHKQNTNYDCRLCVYSGVDIVNHYKKQHPHTEIPCARMSPSMAQEAIKESEEVNFQAISGISSKKYVCRFCFKEFSKKKPLIEAFFWHVVSMHTGEYKQLCAECVNMTRCPFNLDIPPPPKEAKGQLLGYICEKCNYTQISLENLKTHVILRHNDEQTAVYTINLAVMTKKSINSLLKQWETENVNNETDTPRVLRSSRSNLSLDNCDHQNNSPEESTSNVNKSLINNKSVKEYSENKEQILRTNNIQSKITFENDNMDDISNYDNNDYPNIKIETDTSDIQNESEQDVSYSLQSEPDPELNNLIVNSEISLSTKISDDSKVSDDIFDYPHFKIKYSSTGSKDYICCINGIEHYKTTLLISFKKHVQLKHSEKWDGYCFVCKVIVTPQGKHLFKDCLQHFLDKHMDNFPIIEESTEPSLNVGSTEINSNKLKSGPKSYINVRPISELISNECSSDKSDTSVLPVIESVMSLGTTVEQPHPSPSYPNTDNSSNIIVKCYKYEEAQAEMMTKKHRVVLDAMMSEIKLGHVFKCAGRFCSFTTDSAEDALLHASTHARLGGEDALNCVYCDFDSYQNAIDLITHVFKNHGSCQYVCGQCFYRAAASQLVNAHIKRVHEVSTSVSILRTTFKTAASTEDKILTREEAVPHYICCGDSGSEGLCKFRTYTPGKFCEHLQLRHGSTNELNCFMCTSNFKTPTDLIRHLKTHGLKLYQCSWCVHGADNEVELLAHASAFHPTQQPKAYLRIITNKEGSSELRVLPLAQLNKSDVPSVDIAPSKFKDNPVREAERSIELEKLIGQTTLMIESMASSVDTNTNDKEKDSTLNNEPESRLENANISKTSESDLLIPRTSTPIPQANETSNTQKDQIKTEQVTPEKGTEATEVVYCLDSDDDASSNNKSNSKQTKVPLADLFLCAKCKMVLNTGIGLKRHMFWCYSTISDPISCAHCSISINKADLINHYLEVHSLEGKTQKKKCSKCPREFSSLSQLKAHRHAEHSNAAANKSVDGSVLSSLKQYAAGSGKLKRPLGSKEKNAEPPEKTRRFGPQDVDQLPINPILDDLVFCTLCEFNTKVRLNMVRHLQLHAQQQPVPQTAPVNPVPHLETNEKHFDKMVNLASSSIVTRTPDKNKTDNNTAAILLPPEAVSRFPKYVPEKHRLTCGARGCSYTSVDEAMLKYHWETLHHGSTDFHCVHCPPRQNFDMSQPLTLPRIMAHLKMHDSRLYACPFCTYYHHKREIVQKHLNDTHKGGQVMIVREGPTGTPSTSQVQTPAPTMDLKPWHCGLCSFKSLLRPEVVDHSAKEHNSKMQYKCAFCAFRTSNAENITKHQSKSHPDRPEEIFYYYYREGSVPDEPDGTERWQKQTQKTDTVTQIKSETSSITPPPLQPLSKPGTEQVDLNLVKKEIIEPVDETIEDLCRDFGEFCEPNGLKYKCSLCKNVIEDNIEAIQSHLYEELKYRKWGCSICSYKAFHKAGLSEHMIMEHRQNRDPIALQVDYRVEMWVNKLLEHQTSLIEKYKENLVKQKAEILRSNPGPSSAKPQPQSTTENQTNDTSDPSNMSIEELEKLFGSFGTPVAGSFCCPKCKATFKDEDLMQNHLESELNKIRWYCSACFLTFQTYHEAQFHCRSAHVSLRPAARPVESPRDAGARSAWLRTALAVQRLGLHDAPRPPAADTPAPDDSLLVVRYEEKVPTPEDHVRSSDHDSDDEKLVIDEPLEKRMTSSRTCTVCGHVSYHNQQFRNHTLKHYNLRPFDCGYCNFNGARRSVVNHQKKFHAPKPLLILAATVPKESPLEYIEKRKAQDEADETICLVCQHTLPAYEVGGHVHGNTAPMFGKRDDIVVKCNVCLSIYKDVSLLMVHHKAHHPTMEVNYASVKLGSIVIKGSNYKCNMCLTRFICMKDLKSHIKSKCSGPTKKTSTLPTCDEVIDLDQDEEIGRKRKIMDTPIPNKKVAKKSTTKLPHSRFARKSTTKLPFNSPNEGGYSFYGAQPTTDDLNAITTMMPFCNTMVPFTLKKLNEIINIKPVVIVDKIIPNPNE